MRPVHCRGLAVALAVVASVPRAAAQTPSAQTPSAQTPSAQTPSAQTPDDRAVAGALANRLERTLAWQRLLHYRSDLDGGLESEIDGGAFFLSPHGKTSPRDELAATTRAFFAPQQPDALDAHARCRFPARAAFLSDALGLDERLAAVRCPQLDAFLARMQPEAVALVYVGASVRHPASAIVHAFLAIGPRTGFASAILGKHGVDYLPEVTTNNPVTYVIAGMSGGFDGRFEIAPFADKLDEYNHDSHRDIWQYELRLTAAEARRVALHLWELQHATIEYYYLSENCAYHMLSLVEGAVPRLDLTSQTNEVVMPLDAIKALPADQVRGVTTFPSVGRRARDGIAPGSDAGADHPAAGHGPLRFRFGTGMSSRSPSPFAALGFRLALHDILDRPRGHAELVQVQLLDAVLRLDWASSSIHFDELTFMEMMTLRPMSARDLAPSWRIRAVGTRLHDAGCPSGDCFVQGLNGGVGAAVATAGGTFTLFGIAEGWTLVGAELEGVADAGSASASGPTSARVSASTTSSPC
jgi:hypothetical protein